MSNRHLFATLKFHDARRGIAFLETLGFTTAAVYADDNDPATVFHAELHWRDGGGVMCGSTGSGSTDLDATAGRGTFYAVTTDDASVDAVHAAALAAGGTSVREPNDPEYGGRECSVRDPEGNIYSFGSYPGV